MGEAGGIRMQAANFDLAMGKGGRSKQKKWIESDHTVGPRHAHMVGMETAPVKTVNIRQPVGMSKEEVRSTRRIRYGG